MNEESFDKDAEAWYYKDGKQIIGPVSSYNMDKMVYHHTITGETRVAFKSIDKFVKFSKIEKVIEESKKEGEEGEQAATEVTKPKQEVKAEVKVEGVKPKEEEKDAKKEAKKQVKPVVNVDDHEEFPSL